MRFGGAPVAETPFASHVFGAAQLPAAGGAAIAKGLAMLPGVTVTNQTGSPSQSDVRVRGFVLSPIVGVPQSVSVFVDGVRVNEADGSQVHLSLIPESAVERVELVRGPVGVFGKNAIAGALNVVTRRGTAGPMLEAEIRGGSFGTAAMTASASATLGPLDALLVGSYARSTGWRVLQGSEELSLFAKIGWRGERTDTWLSYTLERDSLEGPGLLPESWIRGGPLPPEVTSPPNDRRRLQYTGGAGDYFRPTLHFVTGTVQRELGDRWTLQAVGFARFADFRQANDNISEPDALGLTDIGSMGTTVQLVHRSAAGMLWSFGAEAVVNDVEIEIRELPNRNFRSVVPATTERLRTEEDNLGAFVEAWWALTPGAGIYTSWRVDRVSLPIEDLLDPSDSGENRFAEISGGVGASFDLTPWLTGFASYGRGFRAPVILEVTCADPLDACQLPFELGPDPPLEPVTSDTWQGGVRLAGARSQGSLVAYWTEVHDDIFNVVDEVTPTRGYFTNLDRTRRVGIEIGGSTALPKLPGLTLTASLGWTRATFESEADLASPLVEADDDPGAPGEEDEAGGVHVEPGDRFPMTPELAATASARYAFGSFALESGATYTGPQYLIGDEGNEQEIDGLSASVVLHSAAELDLGNLTLFTRVDNVLDSDFQTFGMISENARGPVTGVERFLAPGLPRRLSTGVRVRFGSGARPAGRS